MRILPLLLLASATLLTNCTTGRKPVEMIRSEVPADYRARHPIIVGQRGAYLPHQCGQWPNDLGSDFFENVKNKADWNYACSTQKNLAAMIRNPNDLIQPRAETEIYASRRQKVIETFASGKDPSIKWGIDDKNKVSKAGGGN